MGVRVRWTSYGRAAAEALRAAVAEAKAGDPLAPVTVVVPTNQVGVASRRLLGSGELGPVAGSGAGVAAVTFLTTYRLAELLGAPALAAAGRRPVSTPVLAAALRGALQAAPGVFEPVAQHPATESALVAAYKELRDLDDATLDALARRSRRASDVVRLQRAARAALRDRWYDEEDLIEAAVDRLDSDPLALAGIGGLVVHLPRRLSSHGALLLRAAGGGTELLVVAGTTGAPAADDATSLALRRLGATEDVPPPGDAMAVVGPERTRIVSCSDPDEEVRAGVRAVVAAVRAGTPLDRVGVLYASPEPYARTAHEQLASAGILHNGASVMPLTARVAGRTLLGFLGLARGGFRREDVFAWLSGARLRHGGRLLPATAWERVSRDAGVVAGREQWDGLLERFANAAEDDAAQAEDDPDAPAWRSERQRADAELARGLRGFVLEIVDDMAAAAAGPRRWSDHARWARRRLEDLLGGERRRATWPLPEQRAAERVEHAVDRLERLDGVEGPVSLDVFARTLELELEADPGRVGRMGEGALLGSLAMGVGLDLDLVVVLGMAEGLLPARVRDDALLPDRERAAAGDALALRAEATERQHHDLLASLAGARRQLCTVPRGDLRRSAERVPSRWAVQIATALAGQPVSSEHLLGGEADWLDHVASFDAGLRLVQDPADEQEYRLRALLAASDPRHFDDAVVRAGIELVHARRSERFTRFDGNLAGRPVPSPTDRPTSPTRIQGWASCPFGYFVEQILRVKPVENPEDSLTISALDRGSLVHEVLERFVDEVLADPASRMPAPDIPWSPADRAALLAIAEAVCAEYEARGLVGRPIFWQRDKRRILGDLERFLAEDGAARAQLRSRPLATELPFGLPGASTGPVAVPLPDGRSVQFRGKADRVDICEDGTLVVIDYKTGKADSYRHLTEDEPVARGRHFQLPVYGIAARQFRGSPQAPVHADYWFVTERGRFDRVGYDVSDDVLEVTSETLAQVVAGIEAGVFPNNPTTSSTSPFVDCHFCDPDALGVAELVRHVGRKWSDPALAGFLALADGGGDEGGET